MCPECGARLTDEIAHLYINNVCKACGRVKNFVPNCINSHNYWYSSNSSTDCTSMGSNALYCYNCDFEQIFYTAPAKHVYSGSEGELYSCTKCGAGWTTSPT